MNPEETREEQVQQQGPLLTCQEFCALQKGSRSALAVFRKTYVLNSEVPENKDVKTLEEWTNLFNDFKNKK